MICGQRYKGRYVEQQEAIAPSGWKGWEDGFLLPQPSYNPEEESTWPESWLWRNTTIVKDEGLKSHWDEEERIQPFSLASSHPLHIAFLWSKLQRIHSTKYSSPGV